MFITLIKYCNVPKILIVLKFELFLTQCLREKPQLIVILHNLKVGIYNLCHNKLRSNSIGIYMKKFSVFSFDETDK